MVEREGVQCIQVREESDREEEQEQQRCRRSNRAERVYQGKCTQNLTNSREENERVQKCVRERLQRTREKRL